MSTAARFIALDAVQAIPAPTSLGEAGRIASLAAIIEGWRARVRFRQQLWRLLRDKPALIEDIGLTITEAKEEIARPFWRPSIRFSRSPAVATTRA